MNIWGKFKNKYVLLVAAVLAVTVIAGILASPHLFNGEPSSQVEAVAPETTPASEPAAGESSAEPTASSDPTTALAAEEGNEGEQEGAPPAAGTPASEESAEQTQAAITATTPEAAAPAVAPAPAPAAPKPAAPAPAPVAPPAAPQPATPATTVEPPAPSQTEYQTLVYNMVRNWCPRSNILVNHPNVVSGNVYGWSWWGISTIAIRGDIPIAITKDIALHECGHILQEIAFRPNPNTNANQTDAINRLNAIYGTTGRGGIEANADCISGYLAPNVQPYSGAQSSLTQRWNSECTGAKGEAAIKVVQGIRP